MILEELVNIIREELSRYVNDEIGQDELEKYKGMSDLDIIYLLMETLQYETNLNRDVDTINEMFNSDLIYLFNISGY